MVYTKIVQRYGVKLREIQYKEQEWTVSWQLGTFWPQGSFHMYIDIHKNPPCSGSAGWIIYDGVSKLWAIVI